MTGVSVIMPARNAVRTISIAIRSVLAQPSLVELLVVDDHSNDHTADAVQEVHDPRLVILRSPEAGIAAAFNHGLDNAAGDYIARCDADDIYSENRLDWQLSWLQGHSDYVAVSGGFRAISEHGKPVVDLGCKGIGRDVTADLLAGNTVTSFCSWLTRAEAIRQAGGVRPWFKIGEDIDLQLRLARYGRVWHEPRICYLYRLHDSSVTHEGSTRTQEFFDLNAKRFALQRAQRGYDDLEIGSPPQLSESGDCSKSAVDHSISLLVGAAWDQHRQGKKLAGVQTMLRAIGLKPLRVSLWKGLAILIVKSAQ